MRDSKQYPSEVAEQYRDSSNLDARIELHRRFGSHKEEWQRWVFDRLRVPPVARLLELGCGPGNLWRENLDRLPEGWQVTLTDFSPGMLEEARHRLGAARTRFQFEQSDAQAIPFKEGSFDAVVANHMLYHVPDRGRAFSEIRRVLKPGGRLYAATNGSAHLTELRALYRRFVPEVPFPGVGSVATSAGSPQPFTLEEGGAELSRWFEQVRVTPREDTLLVTEVQPIVDYLRSDQRVRALLVGERLEELVRFLAEEIAREGAFRVRRVTGIFEALRAPGPGEGSPHSPTTSTGPMRSRR